MRKDADLDKALQKLHAGKHLDKSEIRRLKRYGYLQVSGCKQKFIITREGQRRFDTIGGAR